MLCAMLLVVLGFAHKPITASAASLPVEASYVLPDGSVASLCLPGDIGKPDGHVDRGCEACRLASSFALPDPVLAAEPVVRRPVAVVFAFADGSVRRFGLSPGAPPRGPPALPVLTGAA